MPHRETSLDIQQAIYQSKSKGDDPPKYKERVSKVYSYAVNSTELLCKLSFTWYLISQLT